MSGLVWFGLGCGFAFGFRLCVDVCCTLVEGIVVVCDG